MLRIGRLGPGDVAGSPAHLLDSTSLHVNAILDAALGSPSLSLEEGAA